jgi:hypothetical protein
MEVYSEACLIETYWVSFDFVGYSSFAAAAAAAVGLYSMEMIDSATAVAVVEFVAKQFAAVAVGPVAFAAEPAAELAAAVAIMETFAALQQVYSSLVEAGYR